MKSSQGDIKKKQAAEREKCLERILTSPAKKKLIVAGPGTGKTFTFGQIFSTNGNGTNLAMTFINKLVANMESKLGGNVEVKTFHAYCKKILHERFGGFELAPFLTKVVENDAELMGENTLVDFDTKIRTLDEDSPELAFYLARADYYAVVGFDDSVYRLYKFLKEKPDIIPIFDQIVIDEFQDFNPLEVAFISELEKKGSILIVGDDDQAVYDGRSASPDHLRSMFISGEYSIFELHFCSRCPEVIVNATKAVIKKAEYSGYLNGRLPKRFECYLPDKEQDSKKYPKLIMVQCSVGTVVPKYVGSEIEKIDSIDISESYKTGEEYPTVLVIGPKQYLQMIYKQLGPIYPQMSYSPRIEIEYDPLDGYKLLLGEEGSNLGWRILMQFFCNVGVQKKILAKTTSGTSIVELLDAEFVRDHKFVVEMIKKIKNGEKITSSENAKLNQVIGPLLVDILRHFSPLEKVKENEIDKTKPTILLTSFKGCKGLSAGHVFIVGMNNGSMPKNPANIQDVEISEFIVALTRTRKQCHITSDKWLIAPKDKDGNFISPFQKSIFTSWLPTDLIEDRGSKKATDFK